MKEVLFFREQAEGRVLSSFFSHETKSKLILTLVFFIIFLAVITKKMYIYFVHDT